VVVVRSGWFAARLVWLWVGWRGCCQVWLGRSAVGVALCRLAWLLSGLVGSQRGWCGAEIGTHRKCILFNPLLLRTIAAYRTNVFVF